jgi:hypothetical protein
MDLREQLAAGRPAVLRGSRREGTKGEIDVD